MTTRWFNDNAAEYGDFLEVSWIESLREIVIDSHPLFDPLDELFQSWQAISATRSLPWLFVQASDRLCDRSTQDFCEGARTAVEYVRNHLTRGLGNQGALNGTRKLQLTRALAQTEKDFVQRVEHSREEVLEAERGARNVAFWSDLVESNHQFKDALWGMQALVFAGVYFHYERFLTEAVGRKCGCKADVQSRDFPKLVRSAFTDEAVNRMGKVTLKDGQKIRNAVAHSGGKMTKAFSEDNQLRRRLERAGFILDESDRIHVNAGHSRELYKVAKEVVDWICRNYT